MVKQASDTAHARTVIHNVGSRTQALVIANPLGRQVPGVTAGLTFAATALPADNRVAVVSNVRRSVTDYRAVLLDRRLGSDGLRLTGLGATAQVIFIFQSCLGGHCRKFGPERSFNVFILPASRPGPWLRKSYEIALAGHNIVSLSAILFHVANDVQIRSRAVFFTWCRSSSE